MKEQDINRSSYLKKLSFWKDKKIIKVITGVRRAGKSTLLLQFQKKLLDSGIKKEQITSINFEDMDNESLCSYRTLHQFIKSKMKPGRTQYIFLDEIQHVKEYQKAVDSLFAKGGCDIYITGSNAYFMSGELATLLSGRYVQIEILPFSFAEFRSAFPKEQKAETLFTEYTESGSFPYTICLGSSISGKKEYLRDLYNSVLLKDIVARLKIADVETLERITKFMMNAVGCQINYTNIARALTSSGNKCDPKTAAKYVRGLCDSQLFYEVTRYNIRGKQFLTTQNKYYPVDTGLRNLLSKSGSSDSGHLLENIIYLELRRRYTEVFTGEIDGEEIDFIVKNDNGGIEYFQVSLSTLSEDTLKRELSPLKKLRDNYPKYLITLDSVFQTADYDGIKKVNALDFLLALK